MKKVNLLFLLMLVMSVIPTSCATDQMDNNQLEQITIEVDDSYGKRGDSTEVNPIILAFLEDEFREIRVGDEIDIIETDTIHNTVLGQVTIKILCKYLNPNSGSIYGYGVANNGKYYFFRKSVSIVDGEAVWTTTGHVVDKPGCL